MEKQNLTVGEMKRQMEHRSQKYLVAFLILFLMGGPLLTLLGVFAISMKWEIALWVVLVISVVCLISCVACFAKSLDLTSKS